MKLKQTAVFVAAALFATTAFSGDKHHKTEIKVVAGGSGNEAIVVLDSDELGFDPYEMQVGENRSFVDKSGRAVLVTRSEDGLTIEADGKTIDVTAFGGAHDQAVRVHGNADMHDIDVKVLHDTMIVDVAASDAVMIFSGKEIDDATQQLIRSALESAGHSNVSFAGGSDGGGLHQIVVTEKLHEVRELVE